MEKRKENGLIGLSQTLRASKAYQERADCSVIAVSMATNIDYPTVWKAFSAAGRKPRNRTAMVFTYVALKQLGFDWEKVGPAGKTVISLARNIGPGTFLVRTRRHIFCVRDGEVLDYQKGTRSRILFVYRVTKQGQIESPTTQLDLLEEIG